VSELSCCIKSRNEGTAAAPKRAKAGTPRSPTKCSVLPWPYRSRPTRYHPLWDSVLTRALSAACGTGPSRASKSAADVARLKNDPALSPVHSRADFQVLVAGLDAKEK
jgi:hypothetical protein